MRYSRTRDAFLTIQERLIQMVQLLQLRRNGSSALIFSVPGDDREAVDALHSGGFLFPALESNAATPDILTCRTSQGGQTKLLIMTVHLFCKTWMKYYHMISTWDLDTSNTRVGNSKQVEMILNDATLRLRVQSRV